MPLSLKFSSEFSPPRLGPAHWRGCEAEHVVVPSEEAYEFAHTGERHYLALHDICLTDGEMSVDTLKPVCGRDIRDTLTYIPKGCPIIGWAKAAPRHNSFTAIYFDPEDLHEELGLRYRELSPEPSIYARAPGLQATLVKLQASIKSPDGDALLAETLCLTAALEVFSIISSPATGRLSERQLALVQRFIDRNLSQQISLSDLAEVVGLSRFHFSRAFKAATGQPPYHYVASRRVAAARQLLTTGNLPIDAVAQAVGFSSALQFRRAFQSRLGLTPQAYRRQAM